MIDQQVSQLFKNKAQPLLKQIISPEFFKPKRLTKIAKALPFKLNAILFETIANKVLFVQIKQGDFDFLQNKTLQINMLDADLMLGLSFKNNTITCIHFSEQAFLADVTLAVNTSDAISLIKQEVDPDTLFFQRKLKIQGDTELAHHIKNIIDTLDPKIIPNFIFKIMSEYKARVLSIR